MSSILSYPVGVGTDTNYPSWVKFDFYERKSPKDSIPLKTINLFMPESLNNPNTVSWDTERMGFIGNAMSNIANGGFSNFSVMGAAKDAMSIMASNAMYKGMEALVQGGGGRANADQLRGALTGQVRNPYLTMFFRGVDFRTFSMDFTFYPHVESDCELIHNIITEFRANSLPKGAGADDLAFLGYPSECEIAYYWRGNENKYLHKFKRCVLTGIDTNYTGTGQFSVMRNGFPSHVKMHLKFSEIEIVLRDDVRNGY